MVETLVDTIARKSKGSSLPPALVHAIINELSGGQAYLPKTDAKMNQQIQTVAKQLKYQPKALLDALDTTYGLCTFDFHEPTWKFFGAIKSITFEERFLLSCKLGLTRRLGKDYAFRTGLFDTCTDLYENIKRFMSNPEQQIDLLLTDMRDLMSSTPTEDPRNILVLISKLFDSTTTQISPQARRVLENAKKLEPSWQQYLKDEHERKEAESLRLYHQAQESDRREPSIAKSEDQTEPEQEPSG